MRIEVNGVRLFFDVEGARLVPDGPVMREQPTLLLLHGGPGADHATYKPFMSQFADRAQIVYLDHRGNGRSDLGVPDDWTLSQWADDVAGFLNALEIEKPMVMGASFGGFVAQAFATRYPEMVSRLALMCTAPRSDAKLAAQTFADLGGPEVGEIAWKHLSKSGGDDADTETAYMQRCLPLYTLNEFDLTALGRSIDRPEVRQRFFGRGGEWHSFDYRSALSRIDCPTLVMHGARDPVLPVALARELHESIRPGLSRFRIVEDAGHGWIDKPDEWRTGVQEFFFGS
jgi:proline iminopeptidase